MFIAMGTREDLLFLREFIEAGKVNPVIGRTYALGAVLQAARMHRDCFHCGGATLR
jgi:hypothetical protein